MTEAQQIAKLEKLKLDFNQPVLIDSSVYVMYPLTLNNNDEESGGLGGSVCLPENGPIKNRKKTLFLIKNYENNTIYSNTQLNRQTNDIIKTT